MSKFKMIDLFAAIIAISGLLYEVYNYIQGADRDAFGHWAFIIAMIIYSFNYFAKKKNKKDVKS